MRFEKKDDNSITGLSIEANKIGKNIEEWEFLENYQKIMLEAWKEDPRNSDKLYDEEILIEELKNRLKDFLEKEFFLLSAKIDNKTAGIVGVYFEDSSEQQVAKIVDFCVRKEYRKKGVGTQLFAEMLDKIKQKADAIKVQLKVNDENETAKKIYAAQGFETVKKELVLEKKL